MELLTRDRVCEQLGVSLPTVSRLIAKKEIPVVRIGKAVRIRQEDLDAFIVGHLEGITARSQSQDQSKDDADPSIRPANAVYNNVSLLPESAT